MTMYKIYGAKPHVPVVFVNCEHGEGEMLWSLLPHDLVLVAIDVPNWNADLSPWGASVFKKNDFGGQANAYLEELETLISEVLQQIPEHGELILAGYSLAGLFSLYAMYQTSLFSRIVSASGSAWYPDFVDYAYNHTIPSSISHIYLSLGDLEEKTRQPLMKNVLTCTKQLYELYQKTTKCVFELNPGNHFKDPDQRLARGIIWAVSEV